MTKNSASTPPSIILGRLNWVCDALGVVLLAGQICRFEIDVRVEHEDALVDCAGFLIKLFGGRSSATDSRHDRGMRIRMAKKVSNGGEASLDGSVGMLRIRC